MTSKSDVYLSSDQRSTHLQYYFLSLVIFRLRDASH